MSLMHILYIVLPVATVLLWGGVYIIPFKERIWLWYDRTFRD